MKKEKEKEKKKTKKKAMNRVMNIFCSLTVHILENTANINRPQVHHLTL